MFFLFCFFYTAQYQFQPLCLHSGCMFVSSMKIDRELTDKMSISYPAQNRLMAAQTTSAQLLVSCREKDDTQFEG